jgi:hypothetical protein
MKKQVTAATCSRWFLACGFFYPEDGGCSETTDHTRSTRRHIPEDGILHSHRHENLKSYNQYHVYCILEINGRALKAMSLNKTK